MTEQLIALTDRACTHIKKTMQSHQNAVAFRLSVKQTGCSGYKYQPKIVECIGVDDIVVYDQDNLCVVIAAEALPIIQGTVIDFVSKSFGMEQLVYDNPNADHLCGCGESFNLKAQ